MIKLRQLGLRRGVIEPLLALCIFLFLGVVGFAILSITLFSQKQSLGSQLTAAQTTDYAAGQKDQKASDAAATLKAGESPYLTYIAPAFAGSFVIQYPKNWSIDVDETENSSTQVNFSANPTSIKSTQDEQLPVSLQVQLVTQPTSQVTQNYDSQVTQGTLTLTNITVAGIAAKRYTGTFTVGSNKFSGILVVVPVRDKSILFWNEISTQEPEFEQVLQSAKINP